MDKEDGVYKVEGGVWVYIYIYIYIYTDVMCMCIHTYIYIYGIFHIWNIIQSITEQNWVSYSDGDELRICHTE